MKNEKNNHNPNNIKFHNALVVNNMLCFFKERFWANSYTNTGKSDEFIKYGICILTSIISIRAIYGYAYDIKLPPNFEFFSGIGFPLLFIIRKDLRNIAITLCLIALLLSKQWIGLICVGITYFLLIFKYKKLLAILLLSIVLPLGFIPNNKLGSPLEQLKKRMEFQIFTLSNWKNIWIGEGWRSFKSIPDNTHQEQDKNWSWINTSHSDFIQGLYEFGILGMIPLSFLFLLPFIWLKIEPLFISYICLLFQILVDFPFHRIITGILGILIMLLIYRKGLYENNNFIV